MNEVMVESAVADMTMDAMEEMLSEFSQKPPEERAFILIRGFLDTADRKWDEGTEIPDEVSANFHAWFSDPQNRQAKMSALERVIEIERERTQKYRLFD